MNSKNKKEHEVVSKNNSGLPSIHQLAGDSWQLFKKTWTAYLKLLGLFIAYILLAILVGLLISLPITFVAIGSHFQLVNHLTPFNITILVLLGLWLILFFLSIIAIDIFFPIVSIFILQGKKTSPIFDLIRQAKRFFWIYFLAVLLSILATAGGMILFVIPGLLIAFFFTFVAFEVVVEGQSSSSALKRSYFMVKNHFWEVLGRLVVLELGIIIISSLLNRLSTSVGIIALVSFLFNIFVSWYARAYAYLLYKEVRAKTTFPQSISIRWIWVVAGIGWALFVLFLIAFAFGAAHVPGMMHPMHPRYMHRIPNGAA